MSPGIPARGGPAGDSAMSASAALPGGEVVVYQAPDGEVRVDVRLERETVWLRQEQMAELFGRERSVITKHIRNAFKEGELDEEGNVHFLHIAGSVSAVSRSTRACKYAPRDGNKRIGSLLFLEYLRRNGWLFRGDGSPRLADNAMVALALLIAESDPAHKELMIRLVLNLMEDERP